MRLIYKFSVITVAVTVLLSGCNKTGVEENNTVTETKMETATEIVEEDASISQKESQNRVKQTELPDNDTASIETELGGMSEVSVKEQSEQSFFEDRFVSEGHLTYTLEGYEVYQNIQGCGLNTTDFDEISNNYVDMAYLQDYADISNYVGDDGEIASSHKLVMLEFEIHNEDAVGITKKNQFNIYGINLVDVETGDRFYISYFSEAADSPVEDQPYYYVLEQNSSLNVKVGYFVLADGLSDGRIKVQYGDTLYDL